MSVGGPLALAALYAPQIVDDVPRSAGLVTAIAPFVFAFPLLIWLRYSRDIASSGGLFAFVEAAVGRRYAVAQAAVWTVSYLLYLMYTTEYVVYDLIPSTLPGATRYRGALEVAIPVVVAAIVVGARQLRWAAVVILAVGQLVLVGFVAAVAIYHAHPASSFAPHAGTGTLATASGNVSLLFVCSSLPLFFGGDVATPKRTIGRGIVLAYAVTAVGVVASVFPLAANPAFTHVEIPGASLVSVYVGHAAGVVVGLGVSCSVVGVMLVEYLALTRLFHAVRGISFGVAARIIAVPLIAAGPVSLIDPDRFYDDLLKPSIVALWIAQLMAVVVFPLFVRAREGLQLKAIVLTVGATAILVFGLYSTVHNQISS